MIRRTFPRSARHHDAKAADVLEGYALRTGWSPALPIPVEAIIEDLGLTILCEEISEPEGVMILGALDPATGTVRVNESHLGLFDAVVGPERFTYAHELGHWLYDAVDGRTQRSLFEVAGDRVLCRSPGDGEAPDIREVNANGFAAALLLPCALLRAVLTTPFASVAEFSEAAARWGVSRTTLRLRLEKLGLSSFLP